MLDGILGRGFTVKCKSLMKTTRARMEVVRKRAEAKQRFLKEDLGKLLSNGLDINAYGRTEEYIAGMNILSCYDYLDQSCEYILKQLSGMQKLEECPEECKEVVASLMYAAARFSDLPELRDLRDTFQERYGSGLEAFVNQKFVEKISSRSPSTQKRIRVLQNIASEFSINWDSRGFEKRMATPSVVPQAEVHKSDRERPGIEEEKSRARSCKEGNIGRRDEAHHHMAGKKDVNGHREMSQLKRGGSSSQGENNEQLYAVERELKAGKSSSSSHGKSPDSRAEDAIPINGVHYPKKGENMDTLFYERAGFVSSFGERHGRSENGLTSYEHSDKDNRKNLSKKDQEGSARLKALSDCPLPPPYVKPKDKESRPPYSKPKEDKQGHSKGSAYAGLDPNEYFLDPASSNGSRKASNSERSNGETNHYLREGRPAKVQVYGHEEDFEYQEQIPLPKPQSIRRKHLKSSSNYDAMDATEDVGVANMGSSSRRKDHSRRGLQVLFDEDQHKKDDEERMIDKLLLHYSKKPSNYDTRKLRKKGPGQQPPSHKIPNGGESSMDRGRDMHGKKHEAVPPTRSVSLPPEQTAASPEPIKVYNRANSFQGENHAPHVHPKLPDYDDLAAKFAAMKGR